MNAERLIRDYLLGKLNDQPEQEELVSKRLLVDSDLSESVDVIEEELIEEYLDGTLQGSDRTAFETYFLLPPERKKQLEFQQLLHRRSPGMDLLPGWGARFEKRSKEPWINIPTDALKGGMFLHMLSEYIDSAQTQQYMAWTKQYILPSYRAAPGFLAATLLRREFTLYSEIVVISAWESKHSLTAFFDKSPYLSAPQPPVSRLSHRNASAFEILSEV